jgi:ABC-type polar amino acid transport system ATPase subunit
MTQPASFIAFTVSILAVVQIAVRSRVLMVALAKDGMTMIVVSHEVGFACSVESRVVFMDGGMILEDHPSHEFLTDQHTKRARLFLPKVV